MKQQAQNMTMVFADEPVKPTHLILDNDTKYTKGFCRIFEEEKIRMVHTAYRVPNQNAYYERANVLIFTPHSAFRTPHFRWLPTANACG